MARSATRPLEAALAALVLAAAPAMAQQAVAVTALVDLAAEDHGLDALMTFAGQVPGGLSLIMLDLTIAPSDPEGSPVHGVTLVTRDGPVEVDCSEGWGWIDTDASAILPGFAAAGTHLILAIDLGPPGNPWVSLACVPAPGGLSQQVRLRGLFVADSFDVPTAVSIRLTATTP